MNRNFGTKLSATMTAEDSGDVTHVMSRRSNHQWLWLNIEERWGNIMAQIEFFDETTKSVIANVQASDASAVPSLDDQVYIPDLEHAGVYAHVRITGRQFFYSLDGCLTMIRLPCEVMR
jgi:hypothetical protein